MRNQFAHFNWLHDPSKPLNLTAIANDARTLASYDRKLKNAVSKSLKELLERESFYLSWTMPNHLLGNATVASKQAVHLGGQSVFDERRKRKTKLVENLRSPAALKGLATLFGGKLDDRMQDMSDWDFNNIDWSGKTKEGGQRHQPYPKKKQKNQRQRGKSHARSKASS